MIRQIVLALALGLFGVAAARGADDAKAELKKLQGEWPVVAKETHGHDLLSKTEELKIVFDGDKMTFKIKEVVVEGGLPVRMKSRDGASYSVKLDPSASPKAADLTLLGDGPRKGEVIPAIYHLDEDQLWICLGMGGTRPGDFVTRRMPDRMVYKCKRPKPPSEEAVKEMKKLAGTWVGVSVEAAGKPYPEFLAKKLKHVISDGKIVSNWNGAESTWKFEVDPEAKPKAIKMQRMQGVDGDIPGERCHGIYQFDGDELTICLAPESQPRPTAFETKPKTQLGLYKLKREKP